MTMSKQYVHRLDDMSGILVFQSPLTVFDRLTYDLVMQRISCAYHPAVGDDRIAHPSGVARNLTQVVLHVPRACIEFDRSITYMYAHWMYASSCIDLDPSTLDRHS